MSVARIMFWTLLIAFSTTVNVLLGNEEWLFRLVWENVTYCTLVFLALWLFVLLFIERSIVIFTNYSVPRWLNRSELRNEIRYLFTVPVVVYGGVFLGYVFVFAIYQAIGFLSVYIRGVTLTMPVHIKDIYTLLGVLLCSAVIMCYFLLFDYSDNRHSQTEKRIRDWLTNNVKSYVAIQGWLKKWMDLVASLVASVVGSLLCLLLLVSPWLCH